MKKVLLSAVILSSIGLNAQQEPAVKTGHAVGIETTSPRATLDVNGDARLQKVELMTTTTPTSEVFPDCPCVLTIDKFGVIKRIPKSQFVLSGGSTGGGQGSGGSQGGGSGSGSGGSQGGGTGSGSGGNQGGGSGSDTAEIGGNATAITIGDATNYVVSLTYNGTTLQGKIDDADHKITVKIPYTGGSGSISEVTAKSTTIAGSMQDNETATKPIKMRVLSGTMNGNGFITAEITTDELFKVKMLPPDGVPLKVAEFKVKLGNQTRTVIVNAIGGIPDKKFNERTDGRYLHKFIYLPVQGPDGRTWLNNNLGADYANINSPAFDPTKQATSYNDYRAYGSLFQWGRVDNTGYELINWTSSTSGTPVKSNAAWKTNSQLRGSYIDPCPNGWHTPNRTELSTLRGKIGENRRDFAISTLRLPAAGERNGYTKNIDLAGSVGIYRSRDYSDVNEAWNLVIKETVVGLVRAYKWTAGSVRCLKD